jgi:hypothetical protein
LFDVTAKTNPSDDFYVYPAEVVETIQIEEGRVQQGTLRVGEFHYAAHNTGPLSFINKYDLDWKLVAQQEVGQATHSPLFGDPELEQYMAHLGSVALNPADGHIYFTVMETVGGDVSGRSGLVKVNPETLEIVESFRIFTFTYLDAIEFDQVRGLTRVYLPYGGVVGRMAWNAVGGRPNERSFTRFYTAPPWGVAQTVRIRDGKMYIVPATNATRDGYAGIAVFSLSELVASTPERKVLNQADYYYRVPLPASEPDNEGLDLAFEEGPFAYATDAAGKTVWKLRLEGE